MKLKIDELKSFVTTLASKDAEEFKSYTILIEANDFIKKSDQNMKVEDIE